MSVNEKGESTLNPQRPSRNEGTDATPGSAAGAITPSSPFGGNSAYGSDPLLDKK